jgi:hypothetical protein
MQYEFGQGRARYDGSRVAEKLQSGKPGLAQQVRQGGVLFYPLSKQRIDPCQRLLVEWMRQYAVVSIRRQVGYRENQLYGLVPGIVRTMSKEGVAALQTTVTVVQRFSHSLGL